MVCYSPIAGFMQQESFGKSKFVACTAAQSAFVNDYKRNPLSEETIFIPCGQCIGCRLERSRVWAARIMHEAQLHADNCFITLTYNDDNLPVSGSLVKSDFVNFMKRLRKEFDFKKIRYYQCGEYGDDLQRPHYHACIFGHIFDDLVVYKNTDNGVIYSSQCLSRIWGKGFCTVAALTFESAAYVARYCMKKVNGDLSIEHYHGREPEYANMSRMPGIGSGWYDRFKSDVFPHDNIIVNGAKCGVPRYYDKLLAKEDELLLGVLKEKRKASASVRLKDNTFRRLNDRKFCKEKKVRLLQRSFETGVI